MTGNAATTIVNFVPRQWQKEAADRFVSQALSGATRGLAYACPGAGKTLGGLHIAFSMIRRVHLGRSVLILIPNLAIKAQWIRRAADMGLTLHEVSNARQLQQTVLPFGPGAGGLIMSYQQAIKMKESLRLYCEAHRPICILDEIHHTASSSMDRDGNVWGTAVEYACLPCSFNLCLTGTPFRQGNSPIAFVNYNEGGEAQAATTYSYAEAIKDHVCRPIEFNFFDGDVSWTDRAGNEVRADFKQVLTKKRVRERLEAAVSLEGNFPIQMFAHAHERLQAIRSGEGADRRAGGMIVAKDRKHAEAIAKAMEEITGTLPVVVHNEIEEAQAKIDAFTDGDDEWIIGINMLSEGVDIPRLRVGVYASRNRAQLYFHQFCGRFMRVQDSHRERSYVLLPADPELEAVALKIERECYHALGEEADRKSGGGGRGRPRKELDVSHSEAEISAVAFSGRVLPVGFLILHRDRISAFRSGSPARHNLSDLEILTMMLDLGVIQPPNAEAA